MSGVNLVNREGQDAAALNRWYSGPTLVELLGPSSPKHCYNRLQKSNLRLL
jgi:elongation factor 1 alpha-like protein